MGCVCACVCVRGACVWGGVSEDGGWRRSAAGASSSGPPPPLLTTHTQTRIPLPRYPLG